MNQPKESIYISSIFAKGVSGEPPLSIYKTWPFSTICYDVSEVYGYSALGTGLVTTKIRFLL